MTTDTLGGVWQYSMELAHGLAAEGVQVLLATLGSVPSRAQYAEAGTVRGLELHAGPYKLPWMAEPWREVAAGGEWLLGLAQSSRPDLVHLSEPVYGALPWRVPTVAVGHSCVLSWWDAVWGEPAPPSWERYHREMATGLAAADAVVAPTRAMLIALRTHYDIRRGMVIHNGRASAPFRPSVKRPMVLTAGRIWDPAKNVLALDQAAEHLAWPVYAAGELQSPDGSSPPTMPRHLRLLGKVSASEVATWTSHAAIYALPARYEPFGLSVLEAALAGCALVLGDIASLRELWDGVAVFVPPDQPDTLRSALDALIRDSALREALAMRARRRALGLSRERMTGEYLDLYGQMLAGAVAGPERAEVSACAS
jgi:glycosyltransferase involved in cell wall biosynthesis